MWFPCCISILSLIDSGRGDENHLMSLFFLFPLIVLVSSFGDGHTAFQKERVTGSCFLFGQRKVVKFGNVWWSPPRQAGRRAFGWVVMLSERISERNHVEV